MKQPLSSLDHLNESRWFPVGLFAVAGLALVSLFREFIFSNQMLAGSDMINAGVFFRSLLVTHVREYGSVPMWNPYIFGGMPYVDAFHGDIFYPFSALKFFGDIFRMLGWNFILHIFFAGITMYLCARQFNLSRVSSGVAGMGYMFSGYLVSLVAPGHDGKIFVTTLFPLAILFLDRAFVRKAILSFTLLGVVIGLIILTPHPQMSYFSLWAIGAYGLYLLIRELRLSRALLRPLSHAGGMIYAVVLGLGISAIQFYPGVIYTQDFSPRADTKRGYEWATSWSLHMEDVVGLVAPDFAGTKANPDEYRDVHYWGQNPFKDNSEYAGVVILFLAVIGAFFYRRKGIFFGVLGLFALSYALADSTPLFKLYFNLIPKVESLRAASMIMFLFAFSMCLLAGMGADWLAREAESAAPSSRTRLTRYLFGATIALGALAFLWSAAGESMLSAYSSLFYNELKSTLIGQGQYTKWDVAIANLPAAKRGFWVSFVLVGLAASLIYLTLRGKVSRVWLMGLAILPIFDGVRFNQRFIETFDQNTVFAANPLTQFFENHPGQYRVLSAQAFSGDYLGYFGIETVDGYHGNQLRWYDDLMGGLEKRNLYNPRFLNLVGARYVVLPERLNPPVDAFGAQPITEALTFRGLRVFENPNAFPRAFLVESLIVVPERKEIYPRIMSGTEDLQRVAFVEAPPSEWSGARGTPAEHVVDSVWVTHAGLDSITLKYSIGQDMPLVLTTAFYDGWKLMIDGVARPTFRADGAFLGALLPAGSGEVNFLFESPRYVDGKRITFWALAVALLGIVGGVFVGRSRKTEPSDGE